MEKVLDEVTKLYPAYSSHHALEAIVYFIARFVMTLSDAQQKQALDKQVREWTAKMRRLAGLVATAKGKSCALVLLTGDDGYAHLAPDEIVNDGIRVLPGFIWSCQSTQLISENPTPWASRKQPVPVKKGPMPF